MSQFVFSPGQREEALAWIEKNCPDINTGHPYKGDNYLEDLLVDMYFKLKSVSFDVQPNQFLIGIEYKDAEKVKIGEEQVNITLQNPDRNGKDFDLFSFQVIAELLNRLKG